MTRRRSGFFTRYYIDREETNIPEPNEDGPSSPDFPWELEESSPFPEQEIRDQIERLERPESLSWLPSYVFGNGTISDPIRIEDDSTQYDGQIIHQTLDELLSNDERELQDLRGYYSDNPLSSMVPGIDTNSITVDDEGFSYTAPLIMGTSGSITNMADSDFRDFINGQYVTTDELQPETGSSIVWEGIEEAEESSIFTPEDITNGCRQGDIILLPNNNSRRPSNTLQGLAEDLNADENIEEVQERLRRAEVDLQNAEITESGALRSLAIGYHTGRVRRLQERIRVLQQSNIQIRSGVLRTLDSYTAQPARSLTRQHIEEAVTSVFSQGRGSLSSLSSYTSSTRYDWGRGYVIIPRDNKLNSLSWSEFEIVTKDLQVHGGITYSGILHQDNIFNNFITEEDQLLRVIGFDTMHGHSGSLDTIDKVYEEALNLLVQINKYQN